MMGCLSAQVKKINQPTSLPGFHCYLLSQLIPDKMKLISSWPNIEIFCSIEKSRGNITVSENRQKKWYKQAIGICPDVYNVSSIKKWCHFLLLLYLFFGCVLRVCCLFLLELTEMVVSWAELQHGAKGQASAMVGGSLRTNLRWEQIIFKNKDTPVVSCLA